MPSDLAQTHYEKLVEATATERAALLRHPVYGFVGDLGSLRIFMEHHVVAVWDFMTLLKSLQRRLTCVDLPWMPSAEPSSARIINEIVLVEESDEVAPGVYRSHFEIYRGAMAEAGASTAGIESVLAKGIESAQVPEVCKLFVRRTFAAADGPVHVTAAAFLMGREDLVPEMFKRMTASLPVDGQENFKFYLQRHIEVDGMNHGPMARRLLESLCGNDSHKWDEATSATRDALEARIMLWDAVKTAIMKKITRTGSPQ